MKKLILLLAIAAGSFSAKEAVAQTAELQVIHNCADPGAATVDVYVNGVLSIDDFNFREATSFLTLPSGVTLNIGVAPGTSTSVNDTLVNIPVVLTSGQRYVAVASGVLSPGTFAANPDGANTGFQLLVQDNVRAVAQNPSLVDLLILHGATDAPTVDVIARGVATIVDNAAYTNFAAYVSVPPTNYILDVTPGNNNSAIVATFDAPLTTAGGAAAVVFASGFLDPSANQNGEAFGLYAALPNGIVFQLNPITTARLQVIHNAADPAAATVDIYVNGALFQDNFNYLTATPFVDVPSGVVLNIGIAPGTSTSVNDTLVNIPVTLMNGEKYVAMANGVLNPANFAANPDGRPTGFQLILSAGMREQANIATDVDFRVLHGATDAPTVDVLARDVATLVDNAAYSDFTGYISVPAADYLLDVTPGNANATIVATFAAPLSTLGGGSAVVFASGFLDPSTNQNGQAFGLYAALANGTVVTLAPTSLARLQVIHNAADPAAAAVDIYVNGGLLLDNFAFRAATPYIDVPAGVVLNIGVAPGTSTSANDTIVNIPVQLDNGKKYIAIANGVLTPANFAANPNGRPTGFTLILSDGMREKASILTDVDFRALHGATDAPAVDVVARGVATLVSNAAYSDFTGYITVPAADYILDVKPAGSSAIVASYSAPLSGLAGGAAVVFASGFLDPSTNQNGEAFGLFAALADGTVLTLAPTSTARLQVIHNAADPAADSVDIYVNGGLLLDNFAFRTATPYIDVPAGVVINIGVAGKNSASANDTLVNFEVTLMNGQTYVAIANGVLTPGNFAVNPTGRPTGFTLFLQDNMRENALTGTDVDFRAIHGATDAPTVDVVAVGAGVIVNDASYGDITSYITVPAGGYTLNVTDPTNTVTVASYAADLSTLGGGSAVVFASGFLDPSTNQNGAAFGLFAALSNGTVVAFQNVTGVDELAENLIKELFPNPATDYLQINIPTDLPIDQIIISDITGKKVMTPVVNQNSTVLSIDLSELNAGTYLCTISSEGKSSSKRFVVIR